MPGTLLAAAALAATSPPVTVPPQPELTRQIEAADAALFKLFFEGPCDARRFRSMLTDDVEFYHDKGGFNVRKPEDFVAQYEERCTKLLDPAEWRSRRVLVRSSLRVDPITQSARSHVQADRNVQLCPPEDTAKPLLNRLS